LKRKKAPRQKARGFQSVEKVRLELGFF